VKPGLTAIALAAVLCLALAHAARAQQPAAIPDAPTPQPPTPLNALNVPITPGKGEGNPPDAAAAGASSAIDVPFQQTAPSSLPPTAQTTDTFQTTPPVVAATGEGVDKSSMVLQVNVNAVEVPVTVKDSKGNLVAGLTWRDFKVFENDTRVPISFFTVDAFPLSVAFVIDQSLPSPVMAKVNDSLGAIQGALTNYDELAIFTYSHGATDRSGGFTGAQSARVPFIMAMTKEAGTDPLVPMGGGPFSNCGIRENGNCIDPNLQYQRSVGSGSGEMMIPKEIHTLNDAILAAATELSKRPKGRRRIIYVISDGKEAGSKATIKQVKQFLWTNKIAVYGTAVGDAARWGEGYISRFSIPFQMKDDVLYSYTSATGGTLFPEGDRNGIEKSYAKIAEEARNQYTLVYYSHEPFIDGKFRKIEVRVDRAQKDVDVISKLGYYPSGQDVH